MKIKIVKSSHSYYWYNKMIGQIYIITGEDNEDYEVKHSDTVHYVLKEDCEIVSEEPTAIEKLKELSRQWKELNEIKSKSTVELNTLYEISRRMVCFIESL